MTNKNMYYNRSNEHHFVFFFCSQSMLCMKQKLGEGVFQLWNHWEGNSHLLKQTKKNRNDGNMKKETENFTKKQEKTMEQKSLLSLSLSFSLYPQTSFLLSPPTSTTHSSPTRINSQQPKMSFTESDTLLKDAATRVQIDDGFDGKDDDGASTSASWLTRDVKNKEMVKSYVTTVCTMAGTGILGLPFTLKQGGWLMTPLLVFIGVMALYTGKLVMRNLYRPAGRLAGYPETGEVACGFYGKMAVHIFQKSTLLGVSTLFLILAAQFLNSAFDEFSSHHNPTKRQWTLISAGVVSIPVLFFSNMDALASTSTLGSLVTFTCVIGVLIIAATHKPAEDPSHDFVHVTNFPIAFSAVCLSFGGHAAFPTIQQNMAQMGVGMNRFNRVLDYSFATLMIFYVPVAVTGYYIYGEDVASPIVGSLPPSNPGTITIELAMTIHLLMAFPIPQQVVYNEIEVYFGLVREDGKYLSTLDLSHIAPRFCIRAFGLICSAMTAYFMPYFMDFMSLVGALGVGVMVFILPSLFAICLHEKEREPGPRSNDEIIWYTWLVFIILIGFVGGGVGAQQAIKGLIDHIKADKTGLD